MTLLELFPSDIKTKDSHSEFLNAIKVPILGWKLRGEDNSFMLITYNKEALSLFQSSDKLKNGTYARDVFSDSKEILRALRLCAKTQEPLKKQILHPFKKDEPVSIGFNFHPLTSNTVLMSLIPPQSQDFSDHFTLNYNFVDPFPDLVFIVDEETKILKFNGNLKSFPSFSKNLLGRKIGSYLPSSIAKISKNSIKKVFANKNSVIVDCGLELNNELKYFEARHVYINESRVLILIRDITERKKTQQNLEEAKRNFQTIAENSLVGIEILQKGGIAYLNDALVEILGYSKEELLSMTYEDLLRLTHPDFRDNVMKKIKGFQTPHKKDQFQIKIIKKDGDEIWVKIFTKTIQFDGKDATLVMMVNIDKQIRMEEKLKQSKQNYQQAYEHLSLYQNLIVHNFNNILQNINSSAQLSSIYLHEGSSFDKVDGLCNIIQMQVHRAKRLIHYTQTLSKIESDKYRLGEIDLCKCLRSAVEYVKTAYSEQRLKINVEYHQEKKYVIRANELLIDVFENLLNNAVKYNEHDQIEIWIHLEKLIKHDSPYIKIDIADNGIGIPKEKKRLIFKKEFKNGRSGGMGLGLYLVQNVLLSFKALIKVSDRVPGDPSQGSKFTIMIPSIPN